MICFQYIDCYFDILLYHKKIYTTYIKEYLCIVKKAIQTLMQIERKILKSRLIKYTRYKRTI